MIYQTVMIVDDSSSYHQLSRSLDVLKFDMIVFFSFDRWDDRA